MHAGRETRQKRGMDIHDPVGKSIDQRFPNDPHKTRKDYQPYSSVLKLPGDPGIEFIL